LTAFHVRKAKEKLYAHYPSRSHTSDNLPFARSPATTARS
jgi:hypothetical protein